MKKSKLLAGLSAAAMAFSMLSAVPAAAEETVLSNYHIKVASGEVVNLFDAKGKMENCEFDSISDVTGITSVKFIVSVDEDIAQQAINNQVWLGGGLATNSDVLGWNMHEWCFLPYDYDENGNPIDSNGDGIPEPVKECTFTKVSDGIYETVLFNEDGFFKDDDTYAQLWLQNWTPDVASLELLEVVLNPSAVPDIPDPSPSDSSSSSNDSSYDEPDSSYPDSSYPDNDSSATESVPDYNENSWYSEEPITDYLYNTPWQGENGKADNKDTGYMWNGTWNQFITASDDLSDTTVTFVIDTNGAEWGEDDDGNSVYDTGTFILFSYGESSSDSDKNKLAFSDGESINDCEYTEENGVYTITLPAEDVVTYKDVYHDAHYRYAYTYGFNTQFGHIINAKYTAYVTGNTVIPTDENGNISVDKYYALTGDHEFNSIIDEPSCTTEGHAKYFCDCGYSYEEDLPARGHRYTDYWVLDKFPTCKQNGIASRRCLDCGDRTDITPIGKTSHAYEDIILEYSKGDKLGRVSHICAYCGDTYEEDVDVKRPISDAEVTLSKYSYTYNGGIFKPAVTVKIDGEKLTAGKDYTVTYDGSTEAGDANVFIKGIGDYEGYAEAEYTITPRSIVNCDVSLSSSSVYFNGKAVAPGVSVKVGNKTLTSNDYEVSYENNVRAGTATVIVTGKNNLKGNVTKTFEIKARSIKNCTVELPSTKQFFTGERIKPSVKVKCGGKTLPSDDYTVTYKNNLSAGTATVVVTGKNDLSGSVTKTFTINARSLLNCNVTITSNPDNTAEPIVAVDYKGVSIYKGNYTVTYSEVSDGVIAVTITGKNNLRSTVTKNFEI